MKCKYCNEEVNFSKIGKYASGDFCSKKCARTYSRNKVNHQELKDGFCSVCEIPMKIKKCASSKQVKCDDCKKPKKIALRKVKYKLEDIFSGKHPQYGSSKLKKRLFDEGYKDMICEICGIVEWNGKELPTVLDHIDGNPRNHKLSNLRIVCPNCDAQLPTFKSKNIGNGREYRRSYYKR